MNSPLTSKELLDSIESYYIYRRASEPMAVGSDEERFRMRRLAEGTLRNRILPLFRAAHEPRAQLTAMESMLGEQPIHTCIDNKWQFGKLATCPRCSGTTKGVDQ